MPRPDNAFLQLKIAVLKTALFTCRQNAQLPFSTYIITALKLDEQGFVWFFINKDTHTRENQLKPFGAQLEFFRKGCPFFLKIEGEATIEDIKVKMPDIMGKGIRVQEETMAGILLVKVKLEHVVYTELKESKSFFPINHVPGWIKNMLRPASQQWQAAPAA